MFTVNPLATSAGHEFAASFRTPAHSTPLPTHVASHTRADYDEATYRVIVNALNAHGNDQRNVVAQIVRETSMPEYHARVALAKYLRYTEVTVRVRGQVWWVRRPHTHDTFRVEADLARRPIFDTFDR